MLEGKEVWKQNKDGEIGKTRDKSILDDVNSFLMSKSY